MRTHTDDGSDEVNTSKQHCILYFTGYAQFVFSCLCLPVRFRINEHQSRSEELNSVEYVTKEMVHVESVWEV